VVDILNNCDLENKSTPHPEWKFNLIELIQKTIDLNIIPIQEKGLNIIINHDYKISKHLIGHRDKLHRIIVNLFDNSLKFTPSGNITITTKLLKTLEYPRVIIELSIKDTGIGIPADKHEAIFERFTRLSPSGSNSYSGLGLGLCMVKQLAKEIDGEIHVKSTVNQGSCFTCVFPCKVGFLEEYDA
jgi:signal transduction histidine kinase